MQARIYMCVCVCVCVCVVFFHKVILNYKKIKIISKHLYECSNVIFKTMPIYQTDSQSLLQKKEKIKINFNLH